MAGTLYTDDRLPKIALFGQTKSRFPNWVGGGRKENLNFLGGCKGRGFKQIELEEERL